MIPKVRVRKFSGGAEHVTMRVHRADGALVRLGAELQAGEAVTLKFDDASRGAVVDGDASAPPKPRKPEPPQAASPQGNLF